MADKFGLFDYINAINNKTEVPEDLKGFDGYIANKNFSYILETCLLANQINVNCDKRLVFDFYYYKLSKKKRYSKWNKSIKQDPKFLDALNKIMEYYKCSKNKAHEIHRTLLTTNQLEIFLENTDVGGISK